MLFSEPKIPQFATLYVLLWLALGFSALQRAENSSMIDFLRIVGVVLRFSALQRAENSSIGVTYPASLPALRAFQCSSASRKFLNAGDQYRAGAVRRVSVLFSEPKIPQSALQRRAFASALRGFSALQRAENSSIWLCTA